jgi:hypothetical protein
VKKLEIELNEKEKATFAKVQSSSAEERCAEINFIIIWHIITGLHFCSLFFDFN